MNSCSYDSRKLRKVNRLSTDTGTKRLSLKEIYILYSCQKQQSQEP